MSDWRDQAACKDADPRLFFPPELTHGQNLPRVWTPDAAIAICQGCPVADECLATGMGEVAGVWGGLTEEQRIDAMGLPPLTRRTRTRHLVVRRCQCDECGTWFPRPKMGRPPRHCPACSVVVARRKERERKQGSRACTWCGRRFWPVPDDTRTCGPECTELDERRRAG